MTDNETNSNVKVDGQVKVIVDREKLNAYIEVTPPLGDGKPCEYEDVINTLNENSVVYQLKKEKIKEALKKENWNKRIHISQGKPPVNGKDAIITYKFPLPWERIAKPKIDEKGKANYQDLDLIHNVKTGDLLAARTPPDEGNPGIDVYGNEIKPKPGKDKLLPRGKNTVCDKEELILYASAAGHVTMIDNKVVVKPIYEHDGDVDYSSGNIEFVGNVVIRGNVNSGFTVKAEGDIEIYGFVEGAQILAEGSIYIKGGITGGIRGYIKAGENIYARFAENSRLDAGRDIYIRDAIMQSSVKAGGSIKVVERRATIVGGNIQASQEIEAKFIGSQIGTQTIINVGIKPEYRQEYQELIKNRNEKKKVFDHLSHNLQIYQKRGISPENLTEKKRLTLIKMLDELKKSKQELTNMDKRIAILEEEFKNINNAKVKATEVVYPGVKIYIGQSIYLVNDEIKYSQFILENGDVVISPL
ncbi:hypothetical protein SYNTR_0600 [Candidatus Syntrophocurvum alkaliphilum]|uniref:Flagellar Assembly Protein A N-terminal region domain-containing protein n=1 Tax=Candidatus Syntrophocurvum alkaliphilum TaxID=2293317 RepID=A0A6I6D8C0_9FIRM|nr:FapA family protein [Candidatus Syntrophocurvum alkaliphilum]QGT99193.1 hypothetical protein SYNTR_0600 [Candidatus Syntrophocurvum alkaliphilum]